MRATTTGWYLFFSVTVHKIELSFQDDELCQQFILMEKLTFCFWLKSAILAHKENEGSSPPAPYKTCHWTGSA